MLRYLFVYGTLRKNARSKMASFLLNQSSYVGTGKIEARLYAVSWYPAAVPAKGDYVFGDVFELHNPEMCLSVLDRYEDVPSLYVRQQVDVRLSDERRVTAWVYFYNQPIEHYPEIPSGDFLQHSTVSRHETLRHHLQRCSR